MNQLIDKALEIAKGEVGVMEEPPGSNRGKQVDAYQTSIGLNPAARNPWCMAFVYWCFQQAAEQLGIENTAIKSAQCIDVWRRANKLIEPKQLTAKDAQANWSKVKPGMIFILLINKNTGAGHTGFIVSVDYKTGVMTTVEGNSSENGSREGLGVYKLVRRKVNSINVGFIEYTSSELSAIHKAI